MGDYYNNEIYKLKLKSPEQLFYDILTENDIKYEWFNSIDNFIKYYTPEKEVKLHRLDTEINSKNSGTITKPPVVSRRKSII